VQAYRLIAQDGGPGRPYNVCSGRAVAIGDLLNMLLARAHTSIRILEDPSRLRPNDVPVLLGDPSRIQAELGWTREIPLEQTLDDLLEYWRSRAQ
jgi:GDP-4-dehydro-6-deoxy-D-mannose reductase